MTLSFQLSLTQKSVLKILLIRYLMIAMSSQHLLNNTAQQWSSDCHLLTVQAAMINQIVQVMDEGRVLNDILQTSAHQLREVLQVNGCLIFQTLSPQPIAASLDSVAITQPPSIFWDLYEKSYPWLEKGQLLIVSDSDQHFPLSLQTLLTASGLGTILFMPLVHRQSYYGAISLLITRKEWQWTPQEITFLKVIADHWAIALYQTQLEQRYQTALKEQQSAKSALQASEDRYFALLEVIPDAIFSVNRDGIYLDWKAAKTNVLPVASTEIIGKHLHQVFPTQVAGLMWQHIELAFETKETQIIEYQLWINRKSHHFEARIIQSGADEATVIVQNITERVQARVILQEVNNALEIRVQERTAALREANRFLRCEIIERQRVEGEIRQALAKEKELTELKSRFITVASHEFRTPLTTIQSSAELLEHYSYKWSDEKKITHLHRIQKSVKYMTKLLNDILIMGKAEAGQLKLNQEPLDLENFCRNLVEEIQLSDTQQHQVIFTSNQEAGNVLEEEKGRRLSSLLEPLTIPSSPLPCMDQHLLQQIFGNLLSNAIKYSPSGSLIEFKLNRDQERAVFQICDRGIGIPTEDQKRLFEAFHRANNVGTIAGTGLGLAIVKKCVDIHQGQISVESEVGVGTTFTITLPIYN